MEKLNQPNWVSFGDWLLNLEGGEFIGPRDSWFPPPLAAGADAPSWFPDALTAAGGFHDIFFDLALLLAKACFLFHCLAAAVQRFEARMRILKKEDSMRKMKAIGLMALAALFVYSGLAQSTPSQVEFTARIQSVERTGGVAVLEMELTPDFSILVRVTPNTEVKDENERRASLDVLVPDAFAKIEGIFAGQGILALEAEIVDNASQFEVTGPIQSIMDLGAGSRQLDVLGFSFTVTPATEVEDSLGNRLFASDLQSGQLVKAEGMVNGGQLVARQVRLRSAAPGFAAISVEGVVSEINGSQILISIQGGVSALAEINDQTQIEGGVLAVGARVRVTGVMNDGLFISAQRIQILSQFRLLPDELRLDFSQTGTVDLVLASVSSEDLTFALDSRDPSVAATLSASLTVPAGSLTASFSVLSGSIEGRTFVDVQAPEQLGGIMRAVEVEVESELDDDPGDDGPGGEQELEVRWNPDKLQNPALGPLEVELQLNQPAPQDLLIQIFLKDGNPAIASFPDSVMILQGSTTAGVMLQILSAAGEAKIRAALPNGGDTDDLELTFSAPGQVEKLEIEWDPDDLRLSPGGSATVQLRLDRPAHSDLTVVITVKDGDPSLLEGLPSEISFSAGQVQQSVLVQAVAGRQGEVKLRAALPFEFGGEDDELEVEVEDR